MFSLANVILPMLGVIFGAILQYVFTRHLDSQKHLRERRTSAYREYLKHVSESARIKMESNNDEALTLMSKIADDKCQICLYGSYEVVENLSNFEKSGAVIRTPEQCQAFSRMVLSMRNDSLRESQVEENDLMSILFGSRSRDSNKK